MCRAVWGWSQAVVLQPAIQRAPADAERFRGATDVAGVADERALDQQRPPHVVIGPHAVVQGTLEFRREVVLEVSDSAQIGPVKGATPITFHGDTP